MSAPAGYVVFGGREVDWGVPAECVISLASAAGSPEASGESVVEQLGFVPADPNAAERIVVVRVEDDELPVRLRARVEVVEIDSEAICRLPPVIRTGRASLFASIVLREGGRPLLLLDLSELRERRRRARRDTPRERF